MWVRNYIVLLYLTLFSSRGTLVISVNIYIYIYIVIHRQTVSLYHNSSVWLDTLDAWSWDQNPPNFTLDLVLYRTANKRTTSALEL